MSQETAQRDRLSSAVQEDRERLQASHVVQLEKLRSQHDAEFQKLQLMHSRKVRPRERHACSRNAAVMSGEESVRLGWRREKKAFTGVKLNKIYK